MSRTDSGPYVLALDHGTSGCKVALISVRGQVVDYAYEPTPLTLLPGGGAEQDPEQWWVNQPNKPWTNRFFEDPTFLTRLDERWDGYKQEIDQVPQQLLGLGADLEEAIANDGSRWNFVVEPNDTPQYLADWLTTRTAWMDAQIDALASP